MRLLSPLLLLCLGACTSAPGAVDDEDLLCRCDQIPLAAPVTDAAGLLDLLHATAEVAFPELDGLTIAASPVDDLAFFRSVIDLGTLDDAAPEGRVYRIQYDPVTLTDPPSPRALAAVLAHELGHTLHYLPMTTAEYLEFGVWYGTQDPLTSDGLSDYERATDAIALERGCAAGLSEIRTWIYDHSTPDILAEKEHNYESPAEIAAWVDTHGTCAD